MLADLRDYVRDTYERFRAGIGLQQIVMGLTVCIIFIVLGVWTVKKYYTDVAEDSYITNKELVSTDNTAAVTGNATVYYFYTTWCPYCKKSLPVWKKLSTWGEGRIIDNKVLDFQAVDCDKQAKLAERYKVEGYPTVLMDVMGTVFTYDAAMVGKDGTSRLPQLKQFITSSLLSNQEEADRVANQVGSAVPFVTPALASL